MEKRIQQYHWLKKIRLLLLAGAMLVGGMEMSWGQNGAQIVKASNNTPDDSNSGVHIKREVIYVNGSQELYVPEMRISYGSSFDWYIHWYVEGDGTLSKPNSITINVTEARDRGGEFASSLGPTYTSTSCLYTDDNNGFWWASPCNDNRHAVDASAIVYTLPENFTSGRVICDISNNMDWNISSGPYVFDEPTLLKRYVYEIRPASEYVNKLTTEGPEVFNIDFPKGSSTVNFTMPSLPSNYFWGTEGSYQQGVKFAFSTEENGQYSDFYLIERPSNTQKVLTQQQVQQINLSTISSPVTYYVKARNSNGDYSPVLAKFIFNPKEDSGFLLEANIGANRKPWENEDLYQEIGVVDFDLGAPTSPLTSENNVSAVSLPRHETAYGFLQKSIQSFQNNTSTQNQYGLFRSANVNGISGNGDQIGGNGSSGKTYLWIPVLMDNRVDLIGIYPDRTLYDRTHHTDNSKYGYFYYIDASDDPGTIVDVNIDGTLCGYTELVVTAWVSDMTRPKFTSGGTKHPLAPNINLILKGYDVNNNEVVLHRFTSGDAITSYSNNGCNIHLMEWQQLCYRITLTADVEQYSNFHLEVQNNEPHTDGADYAIDDVRIYKTLPNIKVQRENACEASTLVVSTDYATILRNMGWSRGEEVGDQPGGIDEKDYRKYRYGLMGANHEFENNSTAGNVYFSFLSEDLKEWITVNKAVEDALGSDSEYAAKSLRVAVSTVQNEQGWEFYTNSKEQAQINERIMNIRAVKDYIQDWKTIWKDIPGHTEVFPVNVENIGNPESDTFNEALYQKALIELFGKRLKIPRLRCPWYDESNEHLYLAIIDVNNTDLKYEGEIDSKGNVATGKYWVVTFSAAQVAGTGGGSDVIVANDDCTLKSEFTVKPATTILIDAKSPGDPDVAVCVGTIHQIEAYLNFYDRETNEPVKDADVDYIFDWYLGSMEEYDKLTTANNSISVKAALETYRKDTGNDDSPITVEDLEAWTASASGDDETKGQLLIDLMEENLLLLGTEPNKPFNIPLNAERMVALPFVPSVSSAEVNYEFCSDETEVNLEALPDPIPEISQGFVGVEYASEAEVALRLGWPNMGQTLELPIYKVGGRVAPQADYLRLGGNNVDIYLEDGLPLDRSVGTATALEIPIPDDLKNQGEGEEKDVELTTQATLTFRLNKDATTYLKEGQSYTLLIPFSQFDGTTQLNGACDGVLRLPVKIVPEYLTWKGEATDHWYNDTKWNQSTDKELHVGNVGNVDAYNGSDNVTDAFSPLYFTNVTILGSDSVPANSELRLEDVTPATTSDKTLTSLESNIKYDLAVSDDEGNITSYYINRIKQIYFKPGATMLNQHLLDYSKAWVDFKMTQSQAYWMASPLQDVYAGDMYAPTDGGQQRTPAFTEIMYDKADGTNDRWNPAFYQKAWHNGITYATDEEGATSVEVDAVASNWSIEYNDVWVPYSIGKGFYARVEGQDVMVRLPKADTEYKYEQQQPTTRALSDVPTSRNSGQLVESDPNGAFTLALSTVDNDGDHFLIGNPYMAYLDVNAFLSANSTVLAQKYWSIDTKVGTVVVGTPDVEWGTGANSGYIAPMQAFFVERVGYQAGQTTGADATNLEVTFNANMTKSAADTETPETRAFAATNPQLTLTAKSEAGMSCAAVVQKSDASNQYEADKDAVTLLDSELDAPTVYTVAGNYAAAVNALHDYKNVPLGVYAKDGEDVELTLEGASQLVEPLYLYDAVLRSTTPIEGDSYTLRLTGSSHGRYFLTTDEGIRAESEIRIYSPADGQLIVASTLSDPLKQVLVYDLNGRLVESRQNLGTTLCRLNVPGGIYIIRAVSGQGEEQAKLKVR